MFSSIRIFSVNAVHSDESKIALNEARDCFTNLVSVQSKRPENPAVFQPKLDILIRRALCLEDSLQMKSKSDAANFTGFLKPPSPSASSAQ